MPSSVLTSWSFQTQRRSGLELGKWQNPVLPPLFLLWTWMILDIIVRLQAENEKIKVFKVSSIISLAIATCLATCFSNTVLRFLEQKNMYCRHK